MISGFNTKAIKMTCSGNGKPISGVNGKDMKSFWREVLQKGTSSKSLAR